MPLNFEKKPPARAKSNHKSNKISAVTEFKNFPAVKLSILGELLIDSPRRARDKSRPRRARCAARESLIKPGPPPKIKIIKSAARAIGKEAFGRGSAENRHQTRAKKARARRGRQDGGAGWGAPVLLYIKRPSSGRRGAGEGRASALIYADTIFIRTDRSAGSPGYFGRRDEAPPPPSAAAD